MADDEGLNRVARALIESNYRLKLKEAEAAGEREHVRLLRGALARHIAAHGSVWPPEDTAPPPTRRPRRAGR